MTDLNNLNNIDLLHAMEDLKEESSRLINYLQMISDDVRNIEKLLDKGIAHIEFSHNIEKTGYSFAFKKTNRGKNPWCIVLVNPDNIEKCFIECNSTLRMKFYPFLKEFIIQYTHHIKDQFNKTGIRS